MIILAVSLSIILLCIEYLIYQYNQRLRNSIQIYQKYNKKIEVLKTVSYLPSSKNSSIDDDFNQLASSVLKLGFLDSLRLGVFDSQTMKLKKIIEYPKAQVYSNNLEIAEDEWVKKIQDQNKNPRKQIVFENNLAIISLEDHEEKLGCLICVGVSGKDLTQEGKFLGILSKEIILLIKKSIHCNELSDAQQLKAVEVIW